MRLKQAASCPKQRRLGAALAALVKPHPGVGRGGLHGAIGSLVHDSRVEDSPLQVILPKGHIPKPGQGACLLAADKTSVNYHEWFDFQ